MSSERVPAASRSDDEAAIRRLYEQAMDAWNKGSGEGFAAVFTEDGDLVAFDGTHFRGRKEIAPWHSLYLVVHRLAMESIRFEVIGGACSRVFASGDGYGVPSSSSF